MLQPAVALPVAARCEGARLEALALASQPDRVQRAASPKVAAGLPQSKVATKYQPVRFFCGFFWACWFGVDGRFNAAW